MSTPKDIKERAFEFALRIVKLCQHLDKQPGVPRTIAYQLLKAGTSVGANIEEAQAGQNRPDFISKNSIALKEARECHYWLRLLIAAKICQKTLGRTPSRGRRINAYSRLNSRQDKRRGI